MEAEETYTPEEMIDFIKNEVIPNFELRSLNQGEYTLYQRDVYKDIVVLLKELMSKVK